MKAVVIGGSGATGTELIKQLLNNNLFSEVLSFVRTATYVNHPKLKEIVIDFENLELYKEDISGNVAFSCLGTTLKAVGSKENQWKIDYEYQYKFAKIGRENGINTFVLVSSVGANINSKFFYTKMKGKLESDLLKLQFNKTIIFQPPSLIRPNSDRNGEIIALKILKAINKLGFLKNYQPLKVSDLAFVMIQASLNFTQGEHILKPIDIKKNIPKL